MSAEPIVFSSAVEALQKSFGARLTPELKVKLRSIGVDVERPPAAVPLAAWLEVIELLGAALLPDTPAAERNRLLGREYIRGFVQTALGFATVSMAKLMGTKRTMLRMGRNFRTSTNYIDTDAKELGDKEVEIHTRIAAGMEERVPKNVSSIVQYRRGVLEQTLEELGAKNAKVDVLAHDLGNLSVSFRVSWE